MMADTKAETGSNGSSREATESAHAFALEKIYLKDFSFEAPNSPAVFSESLNGLEFKLNIKNSHTTTGDDHYEIVLHIQVHATIEQRSIFMIELDQAGIFRISGYSSDELKRLAGTFCPTTLFPYARENVSTIVTKGGFPPLTLQPINFDAIYDQAIAETAGHA